METEKVKCSSFDKCSAPFCPENPESLEDRWFPEEEICTYHKDTFIKAQRKIANRIEDKTGYFTFAMLNKNSVIGKKIRGIDPDSRNEKQTITTWLRNHKSKRVLSDDERKRRAENIKLARLKIKIKTTAVI